MRFTQDTRDEARKRARREWEALEPRLRELALGLKRKLLGGPHRAELEERLGRQLTALWEAETASYDPAIEAEVVEEADLCARYTERIASARIEFQGRTWNLSGMRGFLEHADRALRRESVRRVWGWYAENGDELDRLFHELVRLRTAMARKLGFPSYVEMGYRRNGRVDYDRADVERYRDAVREQLVPLGRQLRREQAASLGIDRVRYWDESVFDPEGSPAPGGDRDWMIARAREMFAAMGSGLDALFERMVRGELLDLETREGKAAGGYCASFPSHGVPFVFANFNGTKGDVEVFTHEMGHAFQSHSSREKFPVDYLWPTAESAEIHSMSLEFLTHPHMEKFFGAEAERFRRAHLRGALLFLPYGVAVDHFQHRVYEEPEAAPERRHALWREMERTYLPWRDYDGVERLERGAFWQCQLHIYTIPFYYIDYTLAQACALQFLVRSREDPESALAAYTNLCQRGGEAPFQELVRSAGLESPLAPGCLARLLPRLTPLLAGG